MKLPDGKRVADLTPDERVEAETAMEAHIEAYEKIAQSVKRGIAGIQEAVTDANQNDAPGLIQVVVALDPLAAAMWAIAQQIEDHAKQDAAAYEDGLEGLERLGQTREQEEKADKGLAEAGLGSIIRPRPVDPEAE